MKIMDTKRAATLAEAFAKIDQLPGSHDDGESYGREEIYRMAFGPPLELNEIGWLRARSISVDIETGRLINEAAKKIIAEELVKLGVQLS